VVLLGGERKSPAFFTQGFHNKSGNVLLSRTVARAVPSALEGLTAEFGMGSGVTPPLWSPEFLQPEESTDIVVQFLIDAPEATSGARKIMVKSHDRLVPLD
jgi:hypothetical protein